MKRGEKKGTKEIFPSNSHYFLKEKWKLSFFPSSQWTLFWKDGENKSKIFKFFISVQYEKTTPNYLESQFSHTSLQAWKLNNLNNHKTKHLSCCSGDNERLRFLLLQKKKLENWELEGRPAVVYENFSLLWMLWR